MQTISPQDDSADILGKKPLLQVVLRSGDVLLEASFWPLIEIMQATISNKVFLRLSSCALCWTTCSLFKKFAWALEQPYSKCYPIYS